MVHIEAQSTPECQKGVQSTGGQQEEENLLVHHAMIKENIIKEKF